MTSKIMPPFAPRDRSGDRHICLDDTATVVNERWVCQCIGGPFFTTPEAQRRFQVNDAAIQGETLEE